MGFDWSSVVGSIVGTFGAYSVAWCSFRWGERTKEPDYLSKCLEIANSASAILYGALGKGMTDLHNLDESPKTLQQALTFVSDTAIIPINNLLIKAASAERELYKVLHEIRDKLVKIHTNNMPEDITKPGLWTETEDSFQVYLPFIGTVIEGTNQIDTLLKKYEARVLGKMQTQK